VIGAIKRKTAENAENAEKNVSALSARSAVSALINRYLASQDAATTRPL
jgi:hypothetical protein